MVTSGLLIIFNWVLLFAAFPKTSISLATIVYHVNPFVILFLGALVFHEKLNKNDVLWTIVALNRLKLKYYKLNVLNNFSF